MDYRVALRKCRLQLEVQQRDLAQHIGIDSATLNRIEKANSKMEAARFFNACRYLGISGEKLISLVADLNDGEGFNVQDVMLSNEHWLSVVMQDSSMIRVNGKGFPPGSRVMYDPLKKPKPRDFVVVREPGKETRYIRQYIDDMGEIKLKPLNETDYATKPIGDFEVVGVVRDVCLGDLLDIAI